MAEENLLILDVGEKWQRVDAYVDKLIIDEELQKCFFKNPNKVMSDLGIYHVSSDKPTAITNRIFYAIIANRELMNLVIESRDYVNFQTQQNQSISRPLKQQGVQNRARSNDHALKPYLKNKNFLRKCMLILLEDLNKKGILNEKLSRKQVMLYVEKIVTHASNGKPFSRKTPLMKYQSPYPIKKEYNLAEVNAGSEAEAHASFDARSDAQFDARSDAGAEGTEADAGSEAEAHASFDARSDAQFDARSDAGAEGTEADAGSEAEAHASFDVRSDGTNAVTLRSLDLTNKDLVNLAELTNIPKGRTNSATVKLSDALSFASDFTLLVQYLQGEKFSIK
jgi:hypothetical protein